MKHKPRRKHKKKLGDPRPAPKEKKGNWESEARKDLEELFTEETPADRALDGDLDRLVKDVCGS